VDWFPASSYQLPAASLIATVVSSQNDCRYCQTIHGAIAAHHLDGDEDLVLRVKADPERAAISDKLKALLVIAGKTAEGGNASRQRMSPVRVRTVPVTWRSTTRFDRRPVLHVQSLCRRPGDLGTRRSGFLPRARGTRGRARIRLGNITGEGEIRLEGRYSR
jgi:AhpD family alkylhydroperoxidase